MRVATSLLRILGLTYLGWMLYVMAMQRRLIYYPQRASERELCDLAADYGLEPWRAATGEIIGWKSRETSDRRVVVFHGNAGHALHRIYYVQGFQSVPDRPPWQVFLFEYPGYGARPGSPSEKIIKAAAAEAILELGEGSVYLVGESLGSGVATYLASRFPDRIKGIWLITPFTSLADVAAYHYPYLPVRLLLRERYPAARDLRAYHGPLAVLLAGRDEIVPARLGVRLYELHEGPKRLWVQEDRTHNTLDQHTGALWWRGVTQFWLESAPRGENQR